MKDGKISLAELDMDSHLGELKVCKFSFTWKDGKRTYGSIFLAGRFR